MSPSRGSSPPTITQPPTTTTSNTTTTTTTSSSSSNSSSESPTDLKADIHSSTALTSLKHNLSYLMHPSSPSSSSSSPTRLRTRALLRSLHYLGVFLFWRVVRYARYALVGTLVAAIGSTAVGSGVAFVVAPPTLLASVGVGIAWAVGRWGFRRLGARAGAGAGAGGRKRGPVVVEGGSSSGGGGEKGVRSDGTWRGEQGPDAVPW